MTGMNTSFDSAKHPRAGQTGAATGNRGQFAAVPNTEAVADVLAASARDTARNAYVAEKTKEIEQLQHQVDVATLSDLCIELRDRFPDADGVTFELDDEHDDMLWAQLKTSDGQRYNNGESNDEATQIVGNSGYTAAQCARFAKLYVFISKAADWTPPQPNAF